MKEIMKRSLALIMALVICIGLMPATQFAVDAVTTEYIYNWGTRGETATSLSENAEAFYTADNTYEALAALRGGTGTSDAPSSDLYAALQVLMAEAHTTVTSYDETRGMFAYTDCQNGGGKISSFYSGAEIGPAWDSGSTWNREHTWPNSKGLAGDDENDIMMLRPTAVSENSSRSNKAYGESSGYYNPNSASNGALDLRGDVARIFLYVYVRWGNVEGNGEYTAWGSTGVIESLDVLLEWMEADPVDTWELGRNDSVQSITGTRNVFVDYPELAFLLFGAAIPGDMITPSGEAAGRCDHNNFDAGVVTDPTCTAQGFTTYSCQTEGCEYSYKSNFVAKAEHTYVDGACSVCGAAEPVLATGDKVVIWAPGYNKALSTTKTDNYNVGVDVTLANGVLTGYGDTEVFTVTVNDDGTYSFAYNDQNLGMAASYSSMNLGATNDKWEVTELGNGLYLIKNTGRGNYMEWYATYSNWSTYNSASAATDPQFQLSFYIVDSGSDETPSCQHTYVDGVCTNCGEADPNASAPTTVTTIIADYADANSWVDATQYSALEMNDVVTVTVSGGGNTGKYYTSGEQWRVYQTESPSIVVTAAEGKTIVSVKITYVSNKNGTLTYNGSNIASDTVVEVNAESATFGVGNTGTATNGQVRITAIEVVYSVSGGSSEPVCDHANTELQGAKDATCTENGYTGDWVCTNADCGKTVDEGTEITATGHSYVDDICSVCGHEKLVVITAPVVGTAYKFGMIQENVSATDVYYLTGTMSSFYMATTKDDAVAIDVYLEETDGGYYLYTYLGDVKTYINMVVSGSYVNGKYEETASTVYTYDPESKTLIAQISGTDYWFATRNDSEFTTVGPAKTSYNGFYCQFYGKPCKHDNTTVIGALDANCTENGYTGDTVCADCGFVISQGEPILAGHTEEPIPGKDATCTETGLTEGVKCSVCHEVLEAQEETPMVEHELVPHEGKAPTCTENGWEAYETCENCDYTTYVEIAAGHKLVQHEGKAPTCTENGWEAYETCENCDYTTYVEIAGGHKYQTVVTAPTCTEGGFTTYTCSACGDQYVSDAVDALGHDMVHHDAQAPTCCYEGWEEYEACSRCDLNNRVEIEATGHEYETVEYLHEGINTVIDFLDFLMKQLEWLEEMLGAP